MKCKVKKLLIRFYGGGQRNILHATAHVEEVWKNTREQEIPGKYVGVIKETNRKVPRERKRESRDDE